MEPLNACTIVSKNYLPFARVLARSFLDRHPEGRVFVLLVDRVDGYFDPAAEPFELVEVETLDNVPDLRSFLFKYTLLECNTAVKPYFLEHLIARHDLPNLVYFDPAAEPFELVEVETLDNVPDLRSFLFKYTLLECNTAVKPYFLAHLFARHDLPNLVYFDPDILITGALDELQRLVHEHSIVLTPHLTDPIDDDAYPGEQAILQSGAYNLGFVALRADGTTEKLLPWWQKRLYEKCLVRIPEGLFVDQKWMDLVPGIFDGVHVLTDPGYNVAYWNLHGRTVTLGDGGPRANGRPLVFFHFSGIEPGNLHAVSKHQDRFTLEQIGDAAELYRRYRDLLVDAGFFDARPWPYAFARFDNGVRIPDAARALYHALDPARRARFDDPFVAGGEDSFFAWLNRPATGGAASPPYLSRLLAAIHAGRVDLRQRYPDPAGRDLPAFSSWLRDYGRFELGLDEPFLETLHHDTRATLLTVAGLRRRLANRAKRVYRSELGDRVKGLAKRALGPERARALRRRLRDDAAPPAAPAETAPAGARLPEAIDNPGINLVGYLDAETGMGEAARALARALETTGIPTSLHRLDLGVVARRGDRSFGAVESDFRYGLNLLVVNADQIAAVRAHLGAEVFAGRYNVGFWLWELDVFPDVWRAAFDPLHEVWTPSTFCVDAISAVSPVPVRRLPLPIERPRAPKNDRAHFDLPEDAYVFFFLFNYLSYFERKNPLAVVEAFRRAFGPGDDALLLLKTSQSDFAPDARARLEAAAEGARVRLLDRYLDRDEIASLHATADAYVSLHRSEGYGLTLAEAMARGKPVVATPYSGNADFFDLNTGYPVRYERVEIERDEGPYPAGARWAEPDVVHAAERMRALYERRGEPDPRAARGAERIARTLSHEAVGRILEERFRGALERVARARARRPVPT